MGGAPSCGVALLRCSGRLVYHDSGLDNRSCELLTQLTEGPHRLHPGIVPFRGFRALVTHRTANRLNAHPMVARNLRERAPEVLLTQGRVCSYALPVGYLWS